MITDAHVIRMLTARWRTAKSQDLAAADLGISTQYFRDVIHKRRTPGPKLLAALGLTRESRYQPIREGKS